MTIELLKATAITNLDKTPFVQATSGEGAPGFLRSVSATILPVTAKTTGSIYQMVRIPTTAKVKRVWAWLDAAVTTFTVDIGLYYSDSTIDGTTPANQGLVVNADHFGSAVALAAIITPTIYTHEATTYLGADLNIPIWNTSASGLTTNPGGFFDVCFTNTATNSGAAQVNMMVEYVDGP